MPMATSDTTIRTVNVRQPRNAAAENTDFRKRVSLACEGCRVKRIRVSLNPLSGSLSPLKMAITDC